MTEKVTEDDTIVSHNVTSSGKQYVHQDTQNTKENDNQNTKRRIKSPSPVRKLREHYSPYVERKKGKVNSGGLQIKIGGMSSTNQKKTSKKTRYDHNGVEINSKNKKK